MTQVTNSKQMQRLWAQPYKVMPKAGSSIDALMEFALRHIRTRRRLASSPVGRGRQRQRARACHKHLLAAGEALTSALELCGGKRTWWRMLSLYCIDTQEAGDAVETYRTSTRRTGPDSRDSDGSTQNVVNSTECSSGQDIYQLDHPGIVFALDVEQTNVE